MGGLFLLSLFFAPLVSSVNTAVALGDGTFIHPVTAPALILVGALMMGAVRHLDWEDPSSSIPAFLTITLIPFTFNIADGIALGFLSFVILKTLAGKAKEVPAVLWAISGLLALRYAVLR